MTDNNHTGAVFLDLAKAFNSISHEIFLKKTENFNFSQSTNFTSQSFSRKSNRMSKTGYSLIKYNKYKSWCLTRNCVRTSYFSVICKLFF